MPELTTKSPVSPIETILFCNRSGVSLWVEGKEPDFTLGFRPVPPGNVVAMLRENKAGIIKILSGTTELSDLCLELIPVIPEEAGKRLDSLLEDYVTKDGKEPTRDKLVNGILMAYCCYVNPDYPACVLGGKTWKEYQAQVRRDQKEAREKKECVGLEEVTA
jgi:hypothetical protein